MLNIIDKPISKEGFKSAISRALDGDTVVISRKGGESVVMLSAQRYNELEKATRNLQYLQKILQSIQAAHDGNLIPVSLETLERVEK